MGAFGGSGGYVKGSWALDPILYPALALGIYFGLGSRLREHGEGMALEQAQSHLI